MRSEAVLWAAIFSTGLVVGFLAGLLV